MRRQTSIDGRISSDKGGERCGLQAAACLSSAQALSFLHVSIFSSSSVAGNACFRRQLKIMRDLEAFETASAYKEEEEEEEEEEEMEMEKKSHMCVI
ncbi:hypothetical protein EmuJ_000545100 [Echinococcus multilocularis]|uniref:Uncharacterized protein n=1 Tax=Echinococcus multilocularis TaxID=6211 RepID=A0A068Y099_ECHMU|nr:hypothetical protein EmuJ_000545100 [Echinococcus multilocularis]